MIMDKDEEDVDKDELKRIVDQTMLCAVPGPYPRLFLFYASLSRLLHLCVDTHVQNLHTSVHTSVASCTHTAYISKYVAS